MSPSRKKWRLQLPPYRQVPESAVQIYRVQFTLLMLPAAAAIFFFGLHAAMLMLVAMTTAGACEFVVAHFRKNQPSGSMIHSLMIAMLSTFMLPANVPWYVAFMAAAAAVMIGKHFFGGMGRYLWHPALIGRLVVQLFYHNHLFRIDGPLLARANTVVGDISHANQSAHWFGFNWFRETTLLGSDGFILEKPIEILRHITTLDINGQPIELSRFLLDRMPTLEHCVLGAVPGAMAETCGAILILLAIYLIYRGYLHWQLPICFVAAAWLTAAVLPVPVTMPNDQNHIVWFALADQSTAAWLTYLNYHLFSGGLLFSACLLTADMTSRPITRRGQILFAIAAGSLTIIFRMLTPIPIPCYAALLAVSSFIPTIDRLTRPK